MPGTVIGIGSEEGRQPKENDDEQSEHFLSLPAKPYDDRSGSIAIPLYP